MLCYEIIETSMIFSVLSFPHIERETTGGPTTMLLVIDFVAFGLTIICIIIFACMVVYCATRSKKPKTVEAKGDSAYQDYKHSSSGNSTVRLKTIPLFGVIFIPVIWDCYLLSYCKLIQLIDQSVWCIQINANLSFSKWIYGQYRRIFGRVVV